MVKIYVIHYTKLTERKEDLINHFNDNFKMTSQEIEWMVEYDKEKLDDKILEKHFILKDFQDIRWERCGYYCPRPTRRNLKISEMSICLKHLYTLQKIANSNDPDSHSIIMEDDIRLHSNFFEKIEEVLANPQLKEWDIIFPGNPYAISHFNMEKICEGVYKKGHPSTNGIWLMLIKRGVAQRVFEYVINNKIVLPMDWEYNWVFKKLDLNVIWLKPGIAEHPDQYECTSHETNKGPK